MPTNQEALTLRSDALAPDAFMLARLHGEEHMSGLFRFELELMSKDTEIDLEGVLYAGATLGLNVPVKLPGGMAGSMTREIKGVFAEFEQHEEGQGWVKYRAVFVPKLWLLTRSYRSRIFMDKTVEEFLSEVLEGDQLQPTIDFQFDLTRAESGNGGERTEQPIYPEREYVVQYEETDWQFLSRWLEHEGIFFLFHNEDDEEKVVFGDSSSSYPASSFGTSYPYRPTNMASGESDDSQLQEVHSFICAQKRLPEEVVSRDYNWRTPKVELCLREPVLDSGTGLQSEYNDHFKNEAQGKAIAKLRAEELKCRSKIFTGTSSCREFRPGTTFELEEHFRGDFNRAYLLTSVRHEAEQKISLETAKVTDIQYANTFEAIPDDQPFRPERVTPWPSIKGVMHARIDAEGDGKYSELDEHGRYKVLMPYDECSADAAAGKASRWVRMAQPHAGKGSGFHFPLLKGTEVLVTHIDGDPDRPIIASAVPNPDTMSPSTVHTRTRNTIKTASGNLFQIDDDAGRSGFFMSDATGGFVMDARRRRVPVVPAPPNSLKLSAPASTSNQPAWESTSGETDLTIKAAWDKFVIVDRGNPAAPDTDPKSALYEIGEEGRYAGGTAGKKLSLSKIEPDPESALNETGLREALHKLTKLTNDIRSGTAPLQTDNWVEDIGDFMIPDFVQTGSDSVENFGTDVDGILAKINNFSGKAFGSKLAVSLGDSVSLSVGDKYSYTDVSNNIKISAGDGYAYSWSKGNSTSVKVTDGDDVSRKFQQGKSDSVSYTLAGSVAQSFTLAAKESLSVNAAGVTDNSVKLGGFNSNSLMIGGKGGLDLAMALIGNIDLSLAGAVKFKLSPGANLDVSAWGGTDWKLDLSSTTGKILVKKNELAAFKTKATMKENLFGMGIDWAVIANNKAAINDLKNVLNDNSTALAKSVNTLSTSVACLNKNQNTAVGNNNALVNKLTAGVTMIT